MFIVSIFLSVHQRGVNTVTYITYCPARPYRTSATWLIWNNVYILDNSKINKTKHKSALIYQTFVTADSCMWPSLPASVVEDSPLETSQTLPPSIRRKIPRFPTVLVVVLVCLEELIREWPRVQHLNPTAWYTGARPSVLFFSLWEIYTDGMLMLMLCYF